MLKSSKIATFGLCAVLAFSGLALAGGKQRLSMPHRYVPNSDSGLVQLRDAQGTTWAAWAYRNGGEYDLAISRMGSTGFWSEPTLIGLDDGLDQIQPAIAIDATGHVYVGFAEAESGRVLLTTRIQGQWTTPAQINDVDTRGNRPALRVVGDRLVVAYQSSRRTLEIRDLPLAGSIGSNNNEGPDPVGGDADPDSNDEDDDDTVGTLSDITDGSE